LWLLPPLIVALVYTLLPFRPERLPADVHGHFVVIGMAAPGFFWLFASQGPGQGDFRLPYVLSTAAQLAMVFLARWKRCRPSANTLVVIGTAAVLAWLIVFLPATLLAPGPRPLVVGAAALSIIAGVTGAFCFLEGHVTDMPNTPRRWLLQAALAFAGSSTGLLPCLKP
jgi:peptidoglycan/LPS O-acetylase OafA/YrhL